MPRKTTTKPLLNEDLMDTEALLETTDQSETNIQRLSDIDKKFTPDMEYDLHYSISQIDIYMKQTAYGLLEIGRHLVLIREHETQDVFDNTLVNLNIAARTARRMMQAAVKFTGARAKLADLGRTKMLEMITEDDDELEALADGGTLAGLTLDEIDKMSSRELRQALREEKQKRESDAEVHEKMLLDKDQKINSLDKELTKLDGRLQPINWPEQIAEINIQTTTAAGTILQMADQLTMLRDMISQVPMERDDPDAEDRVSHAMAINYLDSVRAAFAAVGEVFNDAQELFGGYAMHNDEIIGNAPETLQ